MVFWKPIMNKGLEDRDKGLQLSRDTNPEGKSPVGWASGQQIINSSFMPNKVHLIIIEVGASEEGIIHRMKDQRLKKVLGILA